MKKSKGIILGTAFALLGAGCKNIGVGNGNPQQQEIVIKESEKFQEQFHILLNELSQNSRLYFAPLFLDEGIEINASGDAKKYLITLSHAEIHGAKIIAKIYHSGEIGFSYLIGPAGIQGVKQKNGGFENDLSTNEYEKGYKELTTILTKYNKNN